MFNDLDTLDAAVGGSTEMASLLVKAEATETRTLLNLHDLTTAFEDDLRRPRVAAGPIQSTYYLYLRDWIEDSGEPGDKYDPDLATFFQEASLGVQLEPELMQQILDRLGAEEPDLARFLINEPDGIDAMLLRFPTYVGDRGQSRMIQDEIEALWLGDDGAITATSDSIVSIAVTDQITDPQTEAISTTIAVALGILAIFFWVTLRQPALGIIAVGPIALVLICVLGTMALLEIPYTLITSIITALSIGIGVDLHNSLDPSLPRRVRPSTRSRESGDPHPDHYRFGVVGLGSNDGARIWSSDSVTATWFTVVRHHGDHNDRLLLGSLHLGSAACYGGLGRVPKHAATLHGGAHVERSRHAH